MGETDRLAGPCGFCGEPGTDVWGGRHTLAIDPVCAAHRDELVRMFGERRRVCVQQVAPLSRDFTWTPEEFMGREGHTLMVAGPIGDLADDPDAPAHVRQWCVDVLRIASDLPLRKRLARQYRTDDERAADEHYWDVSPGSD